jgi:hypothetical protein
LASRLIAAANADIEAHRAVQRAPAVLWQGIDESMEAFDARMKLARSRLPDSVQLLAVCAPHPDPIDGVTLVEMTRPMPKVTHHRWL